MKLPSTLRSAPLVAALIPWNLTVEQYQHNEWQKTQAELSTQDGRIAPELAERIADVASALTAKPLYAQGLRQHHFSVADYEFFTRTSRNYCVWHAPADGSLKKPGFETKTLLAVLEVWKAQNVGYKMDVRAVFVHVGALPTLHKLVALAMRRCKRPDMRFYSYGTHPTVHPERWGLREIYPIGLLSPFHPAIFYEADGRIIGGVATFTAKAILEDPFEIYRLIKQISQHPLWTCYVHPCVVAAVAKISYPGVDILSVLKRCAFNFHLMISTHDLPAMTFSMLLYLS